MRKSATLPPFLVAKRWRKSLKRVRHAKRNPKKNGRESDKESKGIRPIVVTLTAPTYFGMLQRDSHDLLVDFLRKLARHTLIDGYVVRIDFRPTAKFFADGTLLLYSEIQRILRRRPGCIKCFPPNDSVARQVLWHLKLLQLLGCHVEMQSDRDDVTHWQVFTGTQADATQGVGEAIEGLPHLTRSQLGKLFRSVSEALTNVTQHAYGEPRKDGTGVEADKGWWMFVRQEPDDLSVVFCDLGLGVPYTVERLDEHASWLVQRLSSVARAVGVHKHKDGETIQVTVEEKQSRFKAEHRGNGFGNMLESILAAGTGQLVIYSNRGAFRYNLKNGAEDTFTRNFAKSICGTVVLWQIALSPESA